MSIPKAKAVERYTYADYCEWDDDERWELIDGVPYAMSAPNRRHQEISGELFMQLREYLTGRSCKVYYAPFDVRLNPFEEDDTVVQPDLVVICDSDKLDEKGCKGAPDLAIEILSPSTARHDRVIKLKRYQKAGIKEYWMVDPETEITQVCVLNDESLYVISGYENAEMIPVHVLSGCEINMQDVFDLATDNHSTSTSEE